LDLLSKRLRSQNRSYRGRIITIVGDRRSISEMMRFASTLRAEGLSVTAVDCFVSDLSFSRPYGSSAGREGLVDAVRYGVSHDRVSRSLDGNGLHVIEPGSAWPDTEGVLSDERFRSLVTRLSFESDVVLLMAPIEMAEVLSPECDRVVVLRPANKRPRAPSGEGVETGINAGKNGVRRKTSPGTRKTSNRRSTLWRLSPAHLGVPLAFVAIIVAGLLLGRYLASSGSGDQRRTEQEPALAQQDTQTQPAAASEMGQGTEQKAPSVATTPAKSMRSAEEQYRVYTGSFRTLHSAEAQLARLSSKGFDASVREVDLGAQGIWYRVFLIPLYASSQVDSVRATLSSMGFGEPYLSKARTVDGG
jgi:cell division septation protein DedD